MVNTFKRKRRSTNQRVKSTEDPFITSDITEPAHKSKKSTNLIYLRSEHTVTENKLNVLREIEQLYKNKNIDECKKFIERANSDSKVNLAKGDSMKPSQQSHCGSQHVKCSEGFIVLTETEVKRLLGLKSSLDIHEDSTNVSQNSS